MNGVRRFLQGAAATPPPEIVPLPQTPTIAAGSATWPPENMRSPVSDAPETLPFARQAPTAPLFTRKPPPTNGPPSNQTTRSSAGRESSSSPVAGPSSPRVTQARNIARKSAPTPERDPKRWSVQLNTRDELLMSLLASEAVVDSREFEILTSEEVEELKKESQVLTSRVTAINKKLALETKIRDAAVSLSRVNASHKKVSKQSEVQLESANRRVDAAQRELWRISERANQVHKKLIEHRAGVLSFSVRSMEKKIAPRPLNSDSGYNTPTRVSPMPLSPTLSNATSGSGSASRTRFDGAHLFAGHADTIAPKVPRPSPSVDDIALIEQRLKAATDALGEANKKQGEMSRELSNLRLEKQEIEAKMGSQLHNAEDTILALEAELPRLESMEQQLQGLQAEKEDWTRDRVALDEREREVDTLKRRLGVLEEQSGEATGMKSLVDEAREETRREVERKEEELKQLREQWEAERTSWQAGKAALDEEKASWGREQQAWQAEKASLESEWFKERSALEDNNMEDLSRLQDEMDQLRAEESSATQQVQAELDAGLAALQVLIQTHTIPVFSRDSSIAGALASVDTHLETLRGKLATQARAEEDWVQLRRKLEDDLRIGLDKREHLSKELEEAREQREDARRNARSLEADLRDQANRLSEATMRSASPAVPLDLPADVGKIVEILQPLWTILPSPETRAAKFSSPRLFRSGSTGSNPNSPASPKTGSSSLSELDVRSLKTLYDTKAQPPLALQPFTIEGFAARVQALVADDKALIERLLRFAQAHDLLKKNAERAQKLASDSNGGLEVYAKQVRTLEERNRLLSGKQAELIDEVQQLQATVDRLTTEKTEVEMYAAEQGETCRQLAEANDTLSARALTLAEEAADAPEMVRRQLDAQLKQLQAQVNAGELELAECKATLDKAQDELDRMRMADAMKSNALMDELNSMQELNATLQNQLRAKK